MQDNFLDIFNQLFNCKDQIEPIVSKFRYIIAFQNSKEIPIVQILCEQNTEMNDYAANNCRLAQKMHHFFFPFLFMTMIIALNAQHKVPSSIQKEAAVALDHYPILQNTPITFKFKDNIKKSTMRAQPKFWSLFGSRKKRRYVILISRKFKISGKEFLTKDVPKNILIGWLGHELGHVMDYRNRSSLNLIWFGIKYTFSGSYIKEAERAADSIAVVHGMDKYILETKSFILNHADIDISYKERIKKYYLSPEEIMALVKKRETDL